MRTRLITFLLLAIGFSASQCFGHKVSVFAFVEGGVIKGETAFSGGKPVKNGQIMVLNADSGKEMFRLQTDSKGLFSFPLPEEARTEGIDLQIVLLAGEAHRGEWILTAAEYGATETLDGSDIKRDDKPQLFDVLGGLALILGGGAVIVLIRSRRKEA